MGILREAVGKVAQFEETNLPYLAKLGRLTEAVEQAITQKDNQTIGQLMTELIPP